MFNLLNFIIILDGIFNVVVNGENSVIFIFGINDIFDDNFIFLEENGGDIVILGELVINFVINF